MIQVSDSPSDHRNSAGALIVGGTSGIGRAVAETLAKHRRPVWITGRDARRTSAIASEIGPNVNGLALDLCEPESIATALRPLGQIDRVIIAAIERDANQIGHLELAKARRLVTLKLLGYAEVVHALLGRLVPGASIVMVGGLAKDRPYVGSTMVSTVNGGIVGLVHTLAVELGQVRVNAVHPGIVQDTDSWREKSAVLEQVKARTPSGRLVSTADVTGAILFLLENQGVNGVNLTVDGGWLLK